MKFGEFLKKSRKEVNISQSQMADLLHMSRTSVSNLENDITELKLVTFLEWGVKLNKYRSGQVQSIHELAAMTLSNVDIISLMQNIMQLLGG